MLEVRIPGRVHYIPLDDVQRRLVAAEFAIDFARQGCERVDVPLPFYPPNPNLSHALFGPRITSWTPALTGDVRHGGVASWLG